MTIDKSWNTREKERTIKNEKLQVHIINYPFTYELYKSFFATFEVV